MTIAELPSSLLLLAAQAALYCVLPRLAARGIGSWAPAAVLPLAVGLAIGALRSRGIAAVPPPEAFASAFGSFGVLALAFCAGAETGLDSAGAAARPSGRGENLVLGSAAAFLLPAALGAGAWLLAPPSLSSSGGSALAVGLCCAATAVPVLAGIVRGLPSRQRPLGVLALRASALTDVWLWLAAAALVWFSGASPGAAAPEFLEAAGILAGACTAMEAVRRTAGRLPRAAAAVLLGAAASWAAHLVGLHPFLGAYAAGLWTARRLPKALPYEALARAALLGPAAMGFGFGGEAAGERLAGADMLLAGIGLSALSFAGKAAACAWAPCDPKSDRSERLGLAALLQCKGVVVVVAADALAAAGLLTQDARAAVVVMAVASTLAAVPLLRWAERRPDRSERI